MPDAHGSDHITLRCVELAQELVHAEKTYDDLKESTSKAWATLKKIEQELIQVMDANQLRNFKVEGIGTLYRSDRFYAKIINLEQAMTYFETQGLKEQIFHLTPIRERLNEEVRRILNTEAAVPGVEYTVTPTIGKRKK